MPAKNESIQELKSQLASLQEKIAAHEEVEKPQKFEVVELYSWKSPERIFIPRNRKWFLYLFLTLLILVVVILFLQEFIILAPVAAIAFVAYILASVPPHDVEHRITNQGINSGGHSYLWEELIDFWFTKRGEQILLNVDTYLNFPRRLIILVGKDDQEKIKETLLGYLPFREIPRVSFMDKAADYLTHHFHKIAS